MLNIIENRIKNALKQNMHHFLYRLHLRVSIAKCSAIYIHICRYKYNIYLYKYTFIGILSKIRIFRFALCKLTLHPQYFPKKKRSPSPSLLVASLYHQHNISLFLAWYVCRISMRTCQSTQSGEGKLYKTIIAWVTCDQLLPN